MQTFTEFLANDAESEIDYLVLVMSEKDLTKCSIILESDWKPAGYKDFMVRVDSAKPENSQQRHVHVSRKKHTSAKNKQVSWNQDSTRHDKKSFNEPLGKQNAVRNIAANILGVKATALESFNYNEDSSTKQMLFESVSVNSDNFYFVKFVS